MSEVAERTMKIAKIGRIDVTALQWALAKHPELWDQNTARTEDPTSPHHGLSDIWARFAAPGVDGSQPHASIWYDSEITQPLKEIADVLMRLVSGTELGGVLITRIPAGAMCRPHTDPGWHARYYEKVAVQIASAPLQEFHFSDQSLITKPGDCYWFDNLHEHWVTNDSQVARVTAIFCIRTRAFDALKEPPMNNESAQAAGG